MASELEFVTFEEFMNSLSLIQNADGREFVVNGANGVKKINNDSLFSEINESVSNINESIVGIDLRLSEEEKMNAEMCNMVKSIIAGTSDYWKKPIPFTSVKNQSFGSGYVLQTSQKSLMFEFRKLKPNTMYYVVCDSLMPKESVLYEHGSETPIISSVKAYRNSNYVVFFETGVDFEHYDFRIDFKDRSDADDVSPGVIDGVYLFEVVLKGGKNLSGGETIVSGYYNVSSGSFNESSTRASIMFNVEPGKVYKVECVGAKIREIQMFDRLDSPPNPNDYAFTSSSFSKALFYSGVFSKVQILFAKQDTSANISPSDITNLFVQEVY